MPLPRKGEAKKSYIGRYVADQQAKRDFPNVKQRMAVAYSEYARAHGKRHA